MNKYLKDFIKDCPLQTSGTFSELMFVGNGQYNGFWGKNDFDNIMILGKLPCCSEWRTVSNFGDIFVLYNKSGYTMILTSIMNCKYLEYGLMMHILVLVMSQEYQQLQGG